MAGINVMIYCFLTAEYKRVGKTAVCMTIEAKVAWK